MKPVLVDQGVYREFCSAEELELDVEVCYEQDLRYVFFLEREELEVAGGKKALDPNQ